MKIFWISIIKKQTDEGLSVCLNFGSVLTLEHINFIVK